MKLPENSLNHIKNEIKNLDKGEIIIELNDTRNKIDIQTFSDDTENVEDEIKKIKDIANEIHHGKVIIKVTGSEGKKKIKISKVKRERFEKDKKA